MKKYSVRCIVFMVFLLTLCRVASATEDIDMSSYIEGELGGYNIDSLEGYTGENEDYFSGGAGFYETAERFATGQEVLDAKDIFGALLGGFFSEAYGCFSLLLSIVAISLLFSLLNNMNSNLTSGISDTAFFVCYLVLATVTVKTFGDAASLVQSSVKSVSVFINAAAPILTAMLAASGSVSGAATVNPIMLFAAQLVSVAVEKLLLPLLYSAGVLYIASGINEQIRVSHFADFLKKTVKWGLCLMLTVFVSILSIQGFCAYSLDGATAKTAKYVFGTAVPVVGGILSDTIETVVGCSRVVKNATGAAGMVAVLIMTSMPVIKILASCVMLHLGAAVAEPIADRRISDMLSNIASVISLMAGMVVSAAVIFIICIGAVMCLGGAAM